MHSILVVLSITHSTIVLFELSNLKSCHSAVSAERTLNVFTQHLSIFASAQVYLIRNSSEERKVYITVKLHTVALCSLCAMSLLMLLPGHRSAREIFI